MNFDYQEMRTFADSWGLLYMFILFLIVLVWTFRPGTKVLSEDAAKIPFKKDAENEL